MGGMTDQQRADPDGSPPDGGGLMDDGGGGRLVSSAAVEDAALLATAMDGVDLAASASVAATRAAELRRRTAYVRKDALLAGKSQLEIAKAICDANDDGLVPEFIFVQFNCVKLVFYSPDQRDRAVNQKLVLFRQRVELEKPRERAQTKQLVLHLTGVPLEIGDQEVVDWLTGTFPGLVIKSGVQWSTLADTRIKSGERTIKVQIPKNSLIPGYAWFNIKSLRNAIKIRIWHYAMMTYCRKCMQAGHRVADCQVQPAKPVKGSYAAAAANGRVSRPSETASEPAVPSATEEEAVVSAAVATPVQDANLSQAATSGEKGKPKIIPFFTKNHPFSNFYPAPFTSAGLRFRTTEHYLFYERAVALGQEEEAQLIFQAQTAAEAKRRGEALAWDEAALGGWRDFACEALLRANRLKYNTHAPLREKLVKTAPAVLVEGSRSDVYWGVGVTFDDPQIQDPANWRGENKFGQLLMALRTELMTSGGQDASRERSYSETSQGFTRVNKRRLQKGPSPPGAAKRHL